MKLEYKILWIDNDLPSYIENGSVKEVEDFLYERGFDPIIEKVFDEAELGQYIGLHDYDLIISDFNLQNTTGDVIIEDIRVKRQLDTEILFYTAQGSYKNNPEVKDRLAFIERLTFQVGRETLLEKIEKVIELTLKKLLELNATRGLITAATSDLDSVIEEIVIYLVYDILKLEGEKIDTIIYSYVDDFLKKSPDKFLQKYNEIGFRNWFHRIEASRKWTIFRDLLKKIDDNKIKTFLDLNKTYGKDVIDIRNKFAHAKAEQIEGQLVLKGQYGQDDYTFDADACIQIRRKLIDHKKNIEILQAVLSQLDNIT